jgi:hypothetical protein
LAGTKAIYGNGDNMNRRCIFIENISKGNIVPDNKPIKIFRIAEIPHISVNQKERNPIINASDAFKATAAINVMRKIGNRVKSILTWKRTLIISIIGR